MAGRLLVCLDQDLVACGAARHGRGGRGRACIESPVPGPRQISRVSATAAQGRACNPPAAHWRAAPRRPHPRASPAEAAASQLPRLLPRNCSCRATALPASSVG